MLGKRVIVFNESLWAREIAAFLKDEFESQGIYGNIFSNLLHVYL